VNWVDFEAAAPELAGLGRERFERTGVALLGTLRRDGSPRISPVEPYLVQSELLFGVMRSAKGSDLSRDPRVTLHSSVSDPNGKDGEFKLFGRAVLVTDPAVRDGDYEAWWKSYPAEAADVFALDVESAAFVSWNFDSMTFEVTRWSLASGMTKRSASYP
jgi:pyridoxamine 5'-phosphate oxidase-like protein